MSLIVFLDFEASGLSPDSWPVEIGVAWISDNEIRVPSSLIRPRPEWPMSAWSAESAAIHGIPLDALASAPSAEAVAQDFGRLLSGARVLSDAPAFEQLWLDRLLAKPGPRVEDFHRVTHERFAGNANALDWLSETLTRTQAPHRAGPDARRLAKAWREAGRRLG
jgi:DNA polymerase III epsilon subunit-like protein